MQRDVPSLVDEVRKKDPLLFRSGTLTRAKKADGSESDDTFEISFSSEEPYERYFGLEILGHKRTEVEMDWIKSGNAPLLLEHDRFKQIGIVEKASIENSRGTAVVRFGKSGDSKLILDDVIGGIRKNVSVGYEVLEMILTKEGKGGEPSTYRVTKWKPLEVSIVSIPADPTVGVDRSRDSSIPPPTPKDSIMDPAEIEKQKKEAAARAASEALTAERDRSKSLRKLTADHGLPATLADEHFEKGTTPEAFKDIVLEAIRKKSEGQGASQSGGPGYHTGQGVGGLSNQEQRDLSGYSFRAAIHALSHGMGLSGLEKEMHDEGVKQASAMGIETRGLSIPQMVLCPPKRNVRADLTVAADGANVVQATVMNDWIGALRRKLCLTRLGARFLTGLRGNITFPKKSAGSSATWEGETDAGAESEPTTDKLSMSPKRVGLYSDVSKQLLQQSTPDVEFMLRDDLAMAIALAIDLAGINGSGSGGQPTGILNTSGIGSVAGGTNGLAPTWAHIVALETAVAVDNADEGKVNYLTNAAVRGKLKATAKVSSTDSIMVWEKDNTLNGYGPVVVSNQVPSDLDKGTSTGVCSAIVFGNWDDLIIGQWGGLDLVVDPYTKATEAMVRLVANAWADVGVRHPESFAAMKDALTT